MLIEQIIEFESRVPGSLIVHIFLKLVIFMTKKIFKSKSSSALFNAKMLQKAMYLDFPDLAKSQNLTPKCKILNVFWT